MTGARDWGILFLPVLCSIDFLIHKISRKKNDKSGRMYLIGGAYSTICFCFILWPIAMIWSRGDARGAIAPLELASPPSEGESYSF